MEDLFLSLYHFFQKQRPIFWLVFISLLLLLATGASRIRIEEDITRFFPDDARVEKLNYVFRNSKLAERLVFMVSVNDSTSVPQPDSLIAFTEQIVSALDSTLKPYITAINSQVDDSRVMSLVQSIRQNLPVFLEDEDYVELDSMTRPARASELLNENYRQMISPVGVITKNIIANDPLGFSFLALKKLQQLQYDKNIELYNNYLLSRDHRHLIFFVEPVYGPNETGKNAPFIQGLDDLLGRLAPAHPDLKASYFGATAVAAGNARQIRNDTILTVSLMLVLLAVFLIGFFRKKRVPFLILIPVVFGALFSLSCVYLIQGHISVLAIAAGSIILGIAVNYSLHFLAHLKHTNDVEQVIRDLVNPMTLGSATTVLAFLCLQFVNASVLKDVGLFAAFSLIGAALCSLVFLPHFLTSRLFGRQASTTSWVGKISDTAFESKRWLVITILLLTPVFLFFAQRVTFNTDLSQLNFMEPGVREAQQRLEAINQASLGSVYVVSQASDLERALRKNEMTTATIKRLERAGDVQKYSSVSTFLISDSLQQVRIAKWNGFWTEEKKQNLIALVRQEGKVLKFSEKVFDNFETLLTRRYQPVDASLQSALRQSFFDDYIIEKPGLVTVIALANVQPEKKSHVYGALAATPSHAFDRQMLTNLFVEYVHADFNFIVTFTSVLVFIALLLLYGRIELTLITFVPMLITWIWILGIMALVGIEFNIVNVMISTFIFGLGDDYSIFTMDGLLQEYTLARKNLSSIRTSIFLSALTTISGLGVLIFAKHPALRSIAGISIIGIACVFIMSQTIEPFLFRWLITNRTRAGKPPMTFRGMFMTFFLYLFFAFGSFFLTVIGLLIRVSPSRKVSRYAYHALVRFYTWLLVHLGANLRIKIHGDRKLAFSRPGVLVSNHSSFLDILFTVMLHPKLILLTNKWVWNSPVFGGVVRLAEYYPVMEGAEDSVGKLKDLVAEGYSIVVFPEGTRSTDGTIKRFHKGAFYIAELLNLPVRPLLIHGAGEAIPKGDFYVNQGHIALEFLPAVEPDDHRFGHGYAERTKTISRYFKEEYGALAVRQRVPKKIIHKVVFNYLYKGPVLEWYMRVKLRLEKNYEPFHKLVPDSASVLDLGCGYGFLCYSLFLLSEHRQITGVDHDEEKVGVAQHSYLKTPRINFFHGDITRFPVSGYDVIIIADVLHYLTPEAQESVLKRCFDGLAAGGKLIIREGNADLKERHQGTRLTEFFSVKLLKFNKSANDLHFLSGERLGQLAAAHGFQVETVDETRFTSNVIFVLSRRS